ncbi:DUF4011 domain-containing protein [Rhodopirellula sp. JC740]|uniref:DUF4011 domain-containing protein n=1 Tax=Rhodopirellula halodulae TaxID=2894198 RepID=A0ABS8NFI8_9BACT|nr:DUF4011 domain-containing protein [Rhodopirellula sp. JC740]MCC9642293.1 DUF4011 domain-containing protein [Rhodopirellula sp. JC740]
MSTVNLHNELERFRERLLDLSLRNPLLSYRKSKRRTLQVVNELPDVMYERLVDEGKAFIFDFVPDPPKNRRPEKTVSEETSLAEPGSLFALSDEATGGGVATVEAAEPKKYPTQLPDAPDEKLGKHKALFDDKLQTNLTQDKLNALLRYMQREARTAIQETGINYLFLAIGFLSWKESDSSDKERLAPLLLIPVRIEKITRSGGEPRFKIEWDEDDIQFNLSLQKKLLRDFDLKLPELPDEMKPEDYFRELTKAIESKPSWSIRREALLGFFSFHKLSMYADIDPANWDLESDPNSPSIVEQLICGGGGEEDEGFDQATLYAPDYDVDNHSTAADLVLAMDADSSQQSALVDIRNGKNLVIEGPPGTGKSQTITNAIADAIGAGKTVLFVAEKLAALQVVHDRMASLGLDEFCLELHSDAASPRQVFESLNQRLMAEYSSPRELEETRRSLSISREKLNRYVDEMASPTGPREDPLYRLLWQIVALRGDGATVHRSAVQRIPNTRNEIRTILAELDSFSRVLEDTENPTEWIWWGFFPEAYAYRQSEDIQKLLSVIEKESASVADSSTELATQLGWSRESAFRELGLLPVDQIRLWSARSPSEGSQWTQYLVDASIAEECRSLLTKLRCKEDSHRDLKLEFGIEFDEFHDKVPAIGCLLQRNMLAEGQLLGDAKKHCGWMKALRQILERMRPSILVLNSVSITPRNLLEDLDRCIKLVQLVRHPLVKDPASITELMFTDAAKSNLQAAYKEFTSLTSAKQKANERLDAIVSGTACDVPNSLVRIGELGSAVSAYRSIAENGDTLAEIEQLARWTSEAIRATEQLIVVSGAMNVPRCSTPVCYESFNRSADLVLLSRQRVAGDSATITQPMFQREGQRAFEQAVGVSDGLTSRRQSLEESFHMPSVPEPGKVKQIAKTLRRHRRSWLKFLNRDYRTARADLDEFAAVGVKRKLDHWIRGLEDLDVLGDEETAFRSLEEFQALFGDAFQGVRTDWDALKERFEWAKSAEQQGLDYELSQELLSNRSQLLPDVSDSELTQVRSGFVSAWNQMGTFSQRIADGNPNQVEFRQLREKLGYWDRVSRDLSGLAKALNFPSHWTVAHVVQFVELLQDQLNVEAQVKEFGECEQHRSNLGATYSGLDTNWEELQMVLRWVKTARQAEASYDFVRHLFDKRQDVLAELNLNGLIANAKQVAELFVDESVSESATQQLRIMDFRTLLQTLDASVKEFEVGIEEAIAAGNTEDTSVADLVKQFRLAQKISESVAEIENTADWDLIAESGLYEQILATPDAMEATLDWIANGRQLLARIPDQTLNFLLRNADMPAIAGLCNRADQHRESISSIQKARESLVAMGRADDGWLPVDVDSVLAKRTTTFARSLMDDLESLPAWATFCRSWDSCIRLSLDRFCQLAIDGIISPSTLSASYELTVLEMSAESAFERSPSLRGVSGATLDGLREEFQRFDREMRDLGKDEIASRAADRLVPAGNSKGRVGELTELALIRHESQKQRRHCRIRDLMSRAGTAVQALKPCLMMSPLSVSRFIPESSVEFDIVIMDEASQIKPEDALGTMLRAKQMVVVGDPKQLPPTSFFDRAGEDIEDDESTQLDNTESVLEAAMKVYQPFRRLRWHYRSKHESLIRFSNCRFYDDDLVVFPSPIGDTGAFGIQHVFVENATCKTGQNREEAAVVVEHIIDHAMSCPNESLGVGTFNKRQSDLVSELLEKRCKDDPAAAIAVERLRQMEEELFIKNLENLQGDERDVIFVCYTYGKDPESKRLMQRFGPINSEQGWRRLNVLITRSRHRMVVFSSFHPSEIQGGPEKSRGVNAYKDFLNYAMTGSIEDGGTITGKEPDSPFEIAVCRKIEQMGLEAVPQVGVAGFFVDIGVRRREGDRSFVLGIECDGATYHSARSARDRDRLREEIIRSRGWEIHRIWSTDWFLNQKAEEDKLEQAVRRVLASN